MNDDTASLTEWLFTLTKFGEKNGLENIRELLRRLGNPQDGLRIIHVAGSDGKGSTCALIESVLRSSGIRTGLFTSPHIVRPNERIKVGGEWSAPIEGTGGSKLCGKGRGEGLNDEAWKMATTDAISVACKSLGMAADVYCGRQSHEDADQKKSGGDYGSKYESRNYTQNSTQNSRTGNYTPNGQYVQNSSPQAANPGEYGPSPVLAGTGAPAPQYQQGPVAVPENERVHIILATVTTGRCKSIIEKQSARDYDDLPDWQAGIQAIRDRYDVDPDAMAEIERRAVDLRNAKQQAAINNLTN